MAAGKKFKFDDDDFVLEPKKEEIKAEIAVEKTVKQSESVEEPTKKVVSDAKKSEEALSKAIDNAKLPLYRDRTKEDRVQKRARINLALDEENHRYLKIHAYRAGMGLGPFINRLLDLAREGKIDIDSHFDYLF